MSWDVLRELASFRSPQGCAISIYVGFDPSTTPTIPDVEKKFNALLSEAEKVGERHPGGRDCRLALRADIARIRSWWDDFDRDGSRGLALFASSIDGLFRPVPLREPVPDEVRVGRDLYVAPLAGLAGRGDGTIVAVVSRERGLVYRLRDGRLEKLVDESEEQPGQHDQGGWSQANYQRHIENLVHTHLKTVGGQIDKRLRVGAGMQMVVVAPEEMRGELVATLSAEAREAIVGWTHAEAHAGPNELLRVVRPIVDGARARREQEALERWEEELGRGGRATSGWEQTLEAATDGRVGVLLLAEDARTTGWQCPECGRAAGAPGSCPVDGAALEQRPDAADLAIHHVLAHSGSVMRLGAGALADADGVGALLRF